MPVYEYEHQEQACKRGREFELEQKITEDALKPQIDRRVQKYFVVGASFGQRRFDFSVKVFRDRAERNPDVGFRCAILAKYVSERSSPQTGKPYFATKE